jgi:SAM-dependent methyltransferase
VAIELRRLLGIPALYSAFSGFVGGDARGKYARQYIRATPGARILDIGCGPADILEHLPAGVDYTGFDTSLQYIESAKGRFGERGRFLCAEVGARIEDLGRDFDIVLANGVLHHLDDGDAIALFRSALDAMRPGGRLVTLDGCFVPGQSRIARYLLSRDRGAFVRTEAGYLRLATTVFRDVKSSVRHDLMRVPYTHIIMECARSA